MGWGEGLRNEAPAIAEGGKPMRHATAVVLACVLLAGCNRGVNLRNASAQDVSDALGSAARQEPGEWQTMTELETVDLGQTADPRMTAVLKQQIGRRQVSRGCLSARQAAIAGIGDIKDASCRFERFALANGRLDATMRCARPAAGVSVTQRGAYGTAAYDLHSTLRQQGPGGATSVTMHIVGRRTGACTQQPAGQP